MNATAAPRRPSDGLYIQSGPIILRSMHSSGSIFDNSYLLLIAATPFIIAGQVYLLVRKMSEPENMIHSLPGGLSADKQQILSNYQDWLNTNDLQHLTSFQFGSIQVATFQQRNAQRFFSFYFHQKMTFSIETYFDDTNFTCLDTGTSGSTSMFPQRPNQYQQSFPNVPPDEVWRRHLEAEAYLMNKFGLKWKALTMPYEQVLLNAIRLRMQFVRSIPFYPFRALYWYAVMRSRMANRSIQQQYP
jgi:hypothetical protein